jgi:hypothetical protein
VPSTVLVPPERVGRWFSNFQDGHGPASYAVVEGALHAAAADGSTARAWLPFDRRYDGPPAPDPFAAECGLPACWGVLLVRKGGFAVARLHDRALVAHKIGQRHVQGRTKAGGQSQQRFARRRDNQARAAYDAAAEHASAILGAAPVESLVVGGDRSAVDAVLADRRLSELAARRTSRWLAVPDPRRAVLDQAVLDASAVLLEVVNAPVPGGSAH